MSDYVSGANMSLVLNKNETNVATVKGLNAMTLPLGFTRQSISVQSFGVDIDVKIAGGASYDDMSCSGNFVVGDTNGQDLLRQYATLNTNITNCRFYLNDTPGDFVALDLANDPSGYYQVSQFAPGQANKSGVIPVNINMIAGGKSILYSKHVAAVANADVKVATNNTITDVNSGFVTAGFVAGDTIMIDGSAANKAIFVTVTTVAAGTLTFTGTPFTVDLAAAAKLTIHGGN